jgi:hypothetical protein
VEEAVDDVEKAVREYMELPPEASYGDRLIPIEVIIGRWPEILTDINQLKRQNKDLQDRLYRAHYSIAITRTALEVCATIAFGVFVASRFW